MLNLLCSADFHQSPLFISSLICLDWFPFFPTWVWLHIISCHLYLPVVTSSLCASELWSSQSVSVDSALTYLWPHPSQDLHMQHSVMLLVADHPYPSPTISKYLLLFTHITTGSSPYTFCKIYLLEPTKKKWGDGNMFIHCVTWKIKMCT